jgi:HK97 family phage prohead protease
MDEPRASVDTSSWDGNAAMSACTTAADYRAICAGRKAGPADERGSWALPHHKRPGAPPNAAGVRNALSRLPQTQGLTNREAARRHLEAHLRTIQAQQGGGRSNEPGIGHGYHKEEAMPELERRYTLVTVELRSGGDQPKIGGYAAVHGKLSQNLGGFVEQVAPSFFHKSRGDGWPDVVARFDHENAFLLGTTAARTLELRLDDYGLLYEVTPPRARADIVELVERGDVRKSSFAFRVPSGGDEWGLSDQGYPMRTLMTGQLVDVAPVVSPAYMDSSAGLRSLAEHFEADLEEVRSMAAENDLRRFFVKTEAGKPASKPVKPRTFGPAAALQLLAKRADPWE